MKKIITGAILITTLLAPLSTLCAKDNPDKGNQKKSGNRTRQAVVKSAPTNTNNRPQIASAPTRIKRQTSTKISNIGSRQATSNVTRLGTASVTSPSRPARTGAITRTTSGHTTIAGARDVTVNRHEGKVRGRNRGYQYNRGYYGYGQGWNLGRMGFMSTGVLLDPNWNYYYGKKYWNYNDAIYGYCPYHEVDHGCYVRRTFCDEHGVYHYIWDACPM